MSSHLRHPCVHINPSAVDISPTAQALLDAALISPPRPRQPELPVRWFVAFLLPRSDAQKLAAEFLQRLGFDSYAPVSTTVEKRPDRRPGIVRDRRGKTYVKELVHTPLWPRYRFVALPAVDAPFGLLRSNEAASHGLRGLVTFSDAPVIIPTTAIDALKAREAAGEWDATAYRGRRREAQLPERLNVGRQVAVTGGPFRDFLATVLEHGRDDKIQVEVVMFGRATRMELSVEQLM